MAQESSTQKRLQKLLDQHAENRADLNQTLSSAEEKLRKAITVKSFGDNDIMKMIRKMYAKRVAEINEVLLLKEDVSTEQRLRLFDKRKMYMDFLGLFSSAEITIKEITDWVDQEFSDGESE